MGRGEYVDERQGGRHPPGGRLVARIAEQGVEPDDPVRPRADGAHRRRELRRVPPVEAVADDDDDGARVDHRVQVPVGELGEAPADLRPARPAGNSGRQAIERRRDAGGRDPRRQPDERRVEREKFRPAGGLLEREEKRQKEAHVPIHRPAGVAQNDQARLLDGPLAPRQPQELAVGRHGPAKAAPRIHAAAAARRNPAAAAPRGEGERQAGHQPFHGREIPLGAFVEGLAAKHRFRTVAGVLPGTRPRLAFRSPEGRPGPTAEILDRQPPPRSRSVAAALGGSRSRPETFEELVEGRGVARPDLQGRLQRQPDLAAVGEVHQRQGFHGVRFVRKARSDTALPQSAGEECHVRHQVHRRHPIEAARPRASSTRPESSAPGRSRMSLRSLSRQPSVCSTVSGSSASR